MSLQNIYDQILNTILSQEKPAFLVGKDVVIPAYKGLSIANLPGSISRWLGCPLEDDSPFAPIIMDQFDKEFEHVILLLMDGLNLSIFNKLAKSSKFLSPQQAAVYYEIFPLWGADFALAWNPRSKLRGI